MKLPPNPGGELHVLGPTSRRTVQEIRDAQLVVAGHALRHGWQLWELRQVLAAMGIEPCRTLENAGGTP